MTAYEKLMERIGVLEDSNAAVGGDIGMVGNGAGRMESAVGGSGVESSPRWSSPSQESAGLAWPGRRGARNPTTAGTSSSATPESRAVGQQLTGRMPMATITGVKLTRHSMHFEAATSQKHIGLKSRAVEESARDAIA